MLKRINQRFATKSNHDLEKLNEYGFVPSQEERDNPKLKWEDINEMKRKYRFEGDYHCTLCPKKILQT